MRLKCWIYLSSSGKFYPRKFTLIQTEKKRWKVHEKNFTGMKKKFIIWLIWYSDSITELFEPLVCKLCLTCLHIILHKKWSFPLRISSINITNSAANCGLVTFTEKILNGKLHFFCSVPWDRKTWTSQQRALIGTLKMFEKINCSIFENIKPGL